MYMTALSFKQVFLLILAVQSCAFIKWLDVTAYSCTYFRFRPMCVENVRVVRAVHHFAGLEVFMASAVWPLRLWSMPLSRHTITGVSHDALQSAFTTETNKPTIQTEVSKVYWWCNKQMSLQTLHDTQIHFVSENSFTSTAKWLLSKGCFKMWTMNQQRIMFMNSHPHI